jgi:hypothetical protein
MLASSQGSPTSFALAKTVVVQEDYGPMPRAVAVAEMRIGDVACVSLCGNGSVELNHVTNKASLQSAKSKKSPLFVFYAVSLFISTGWLGMAGVWEYSSHVIASQGQVVTATITGKVLHPAGQEGYTKTSYEEDFVFTTAAGKRIDGKAKLTPDSWDRIKPGDTFKVISTPDGTYQISTNASTTVSDCVFVGVLAIWLIFMRLTIRALHRRPTPRARSAAASDRAAHAPSPAAASASVNGVVIMGAGLLVVGGVLLLIGVVNLLIEHGYRMHGRAATAIVLTKSTVAGRSGNSYPLNVRFTTDEGKSIETSIGVDEATMTSVHEHLPLSIVYAPEEPERIWLASDRQFGTFVVLWFVSALGAILAIGGAIMMSFAILDAKRERVLHAVR